MKVEAPLTDREREYFRVRHIRICACNLPEGSWRHQPKSDRWSELTVEKWEAVRHDFIPAEEARG